MNTPTSSPKHLRSAGFTLMELIVTTSVIAILAALIVPAINRSMESARTAGCASNLSQIGKAMFAFAAENDGRLPGAQDDRKGVWPFNTFMHQLNPYLSNLPTVTFEDQKKALWSGVFRCPGKKDWSLSAPSDKRKNSYAMNSFHVNEVPDEGPKLVSIEKPTKTLLVTDYGDGFWAVRNAHYINRDFPAFRHAKRDNVLFCDGHVAALPKNSFYYELVLPE